MEKLLAIEDALTLAIRNTDSRLYLLRVDADDVERSSLVRENEIYAAGLLALREFKAEVSR